MTALSENLVVTLLQFDSLGGSLSFLYDLVEAWAYCVDMKVVFPFVENLVDRERTPEGIAAIPSRAYLVKWPDRQFRNYLVRYFFDRLSNEWERLGSAPPSPPASGHGFDQESPVRLTACSFAELSITEAVDEFVRATAGFAHLCDPEKIRIDAQGSARFHDNWNAKDDYDYVFLAIYYSIIDPFNADGVRSEPKP